MPDEGTKMTAKSSNTKKPTEQVVKTSAELCRKEGIAQSIYYTKSN